MKYWQVVSFSEPDQLLGIAQAAEEAGFEGILLADHLFFPGTLNSKYPYSEDGTPGFDGSTPFPDPWTTIAAMSSVTSTLKFAPMVFILPLRHPIELAKTLGTLAIHSDGRAILGAGAGWIREEFDVMGIPWKGRGKRMDEMVEVMRQLWTGDMVEYHGDVFDLPPMQMSPAPAAPVPIYFGGISELAMRRAARTGQGWFGTGNTVEQATDLLDKLAGYRREYGTDGDPFDALVPLAVPPDTELFARLEGEHGMTSTSVYPFMYTLGPSSTLEQKRDAMMQFGDAFIRR